MQNGQFPFSVSSPLARNQIKETLLAKVISISVFKADSTNFRGEFIVKNIVIQSIFDGYKIMVFVYTITSYHKSCRKTQLSIFAFFHNLCFLTLYCVQFQNFSFQYKVIVLSLKLSE